MIRKTICLALAAALLLSVFGGAASGPEKYVFNPHLYLPVLAQDVPQDYWDAFHNLCDALRAGETEFVCPGEDAYKWATSPSTLTQLFPVACMKISAAGGKIWDDQNNKDGIRPEVITVWLVRNGKKIDQHIGFAPAPQLQGWYGRPRQSR